MKLSKLSACILVGLIFIVGIHYGCIHSTYTAAILPASTGNLSKAGSLKCVVYSNNGLEMPGVEVIAKGIDGQANMGAITNLDGVATIAGLEPEKRYKLTIGGYWLRFFYPPKNILFSVSKGEVMSIEIKLKRNANEMPSVLG